MLDVNWRRGAFRTWVVLSAVWCGGAFSIEFLQHNRAVSPNAAPQEQRAPPCKNGAATCNPWERDWGTRKPEVGSVVSPEGKITPRLDVSVWGRMADAAPLAIAPPLAVLLFGASLFWAFAGFRRG
jgi:hypothetical protein